MTETVGLRENRMMLPHKEVTEILQRLKDGELGVLSAEDELHALLPTEGEPVAWDGIWFHSTAPDDPMPAPQGPWRTEDEAREWEHEYERFKARVFPLYATPQESAEVERERDEARFAVRHLRSRGFSGEATPGMMLRQIADEFALATQDPNAGGEDG